MVTIPKVIRSYCPKCKTHTNLEVERVRGGKPRGELRWGQRRFRRATAGYGGFPRPTTEGRNKPTKKVYLRFKCKVCKKIHQRECIRAKKFEFAE